MELKTIRENLLLYLKEFTSNDIKDIASFATHYLKSRFERDSVSTVIDDTRMDFTFFDELGEFYSLSISLKDVRNV